MAPSFAQACFQVRLSARVCRSTRTVPVDGLELVGPGVQASGATFAKSWFERVDRAATREDGDAADRGAAARAAGGRIARVADLDLDRVEAAGRASRRPRSGCTVRVPVPRSCVPSLTTTEPSGWIVKSHSLSWPRPPQVWMRDARGRA